MWERQTPASHLMHLVHVSRWNRSHVRVRVRLVRAASSHNAAESRLTSNGKHIEQNQRPQLLCVLLVQRIYAIDLAHDATVGERSRNLKFSYVSPRSIYGETSNEGKESASTYPCRSLSGSVQVNGVDGVVLAVILITDDQVPNGRHLRVQHTYSPVTSPMP